MEDRQSLEICTSCSDDSTGCDSDEYCVHLNNMVQPGCCRAKQSSGSFCVPRRNGVDCTSGTCNTVCPSDTAFLGIDFMFEAACDWVGRCASSK